MSDGFSVHHQELKTAHTQRQVFVRLLLLPTAISQRMDFFHFKNCHLMLHREMTQGESKVSIQRD